MVATPLGAIAAIRIGARYVVAAGLLIVGAALAWGGTIAAHAAYFGPVIAVMVLLALGFSLVNAPSTASLMSTLRPDQVGAGSAVNETTRELAGAMGVAVVGSVFSSLFAPGVRAVLARYVGHGLTSAQLHVAASSTSAALLTVSHFPRVLRPNLEASVANAFMQGLHRGCFVAGAAAAIAAVLVLSYLPSRNEEVSEVLIDA
jgi:hypothetical protein